MPKLTLQAALVLILLGAAVPLRAFQFPDNYAGSTLDVCNKGSVPVEVAVASLEYSFFQKIWTVKGTTIDPQKCGRVYKPPNNEKFQPPAYIAFGFANSKGEWGSGRTAQVPDFGTSNMVDLTNVLRDGLRDQKALRPGEKTICVRKDETYYSIQDDLPVDCPNFKLTNPDFQRVGKGPFVALTSSLYFYPSSTQCSSYPAPPCQITSYALDISPSASDRELHATKGRGSGAEEGSGDGSPFLDALGKAWKEEQQRQAKAAADAKRAEEQRLREETAASEERHSHQQSAAAFEPGWIGKDLVIVGTVSRVEVDTKGFPKWVTIYFQESPDATFVVCSPYPDMFQARVGMNLSALVGKTFEAEGQVEHYCGNRATKGNIRVVESKQWHVR